MAPKEKKDIAWSYCQLIDGKMVCNFCQKEVGGGGIHRIKQHLANARGNITPCEKVPDALKVEMQASIDSYREEKAKKKKVQKEVGSGSATQFHSDTDFPDSHRIPSFEESSAFPIPMHDPYTNPSQRNNPRGEHVGGSGVGASASKRPRGNLESFFVPRTTPGAQPTLLMPNERRQKGMLLGNALLGGGMMQTYLSMLQGLFIINLCWMPLLHVVRASRDLVMRILGGIF